MTDDEINDAVIREVLGREPFGDSFDPALVLEDAQTVAWEARRRGCFVPFMKDPRALCMAALGAVRGE